jgi:urease accessory protein
MVEGQSTVTGAGAGDPLKLITTRPRGLAAWAWVATYGGGLLAGDRTELEVEVAAGSRLVLATQATTKIYRSDDGATAAQHLQARIGASGLMAWIADPVCPFAGARSLAETTVELEPGAGLVWLDALTAGRRARDERWAFAAHRSRLAVDLGGVPILRDALELAPPPASLAPWGAVATLVIMGEPVAAWAADLHRTLAELPAEPDRDLLVASTPLPRCPGILVRITAREWEQAEQWIHAHLAPLADLVGGAPWLRRP